MVSNIAPRCMVLSPLRVCTRFHESAAAPIFLCEHAGLDVLEVIGTLDVFAACFAYSAATHSFVQRPDAAPRGASYLSVRLLIHSACAHLLHCALKQLVLSLRMHFL